MAATTGAPTVLLVEPDANDRERYGTWLEGAGMTVVNCSGPHAPGFSCLGTCGGPCALANVADIAVLDTRNLPGLTRQGRPGWRLLRFYLQQGKPVVLIADRYRKARSLRPEQLFVLRPEPPEQSLLVAVRSMLREAQRW